MIERSFVRLRLGPVRGGALDRPALSCYIKPTMAQEFFITKKKMGRPPGRTRPPTKPVQVPIETLNRLDSWISCQSEPRPSRPEAIRRLIEKALASEGRGSDACAIPLTGPNAGNDKSGNSNLEQEDVMAKGQMRSSKEAKKPKAEKPKGEASAYKKSQGKDKQSIKLPDAKG